MSRQATIAMILFPMARALPWGCRGDAGRKSAALRSATARQEWRARSPRRESRTRRTVPARIGNFQKKIKKRGIPQHSSVNDHEPGASANEMHAHAEGKAASDAAATGTSTPLSPRRPLKNPVRTHRPCHCAALVCPTALAAGKNTTLLGGDMQVGTGVDGGGAQMPTLLAGDVCGGAATMRVFRGQADRYSNPCTCPRLADSPPPQASHQKQTVSPDHPRPWALRTLQQSQHRRRNESTPERRPPRHRRKIKRRRWDYQRSPGQQSDTGKKGGGTYVHTTHRFAG